MIDGVRPRLVCTHHGICNPSLSATADASLGEAIKSTPQAAGKSAPPAFDAMEKTASQPYVSKLHFQNTVVERLRIAISKRPEAKHLNEGSAGHPCLPNIRTPTSPMRPAQSCQKNARIRSTAPCNMYPEAIASSVRQQAAAPQWVEQHAEPSAESCSRNIQAVPSGMLMMELPRRLSGAVRGGKTDSAHLSRGTVFNGKDVHVHRLRLGADGNCVLKPNDGEPFAAASWKSSHRRFPANAAEGGRADFRETVPAHVQRSQ